MCTSALNVSSVQEGIQHVRDSARRLNPKAQVILTDSEVTVDHPELVKGKRVCCVEDGPTITHGGAPTGELACWTRLWMWVEGREGARGWYSGRGAPASKAATVLKQVHGKGTSAACKVRLDHASW